MQENTAKTATEWVFVAKSIAQMPEGQSQALRCMVRAVMAAQDVADWLTVAKAWAQGFNDAEMTQSCMGKAESTAEGSGDWKLVADTWSEMANYERAIDWRKNCPVQSRKWSTKTLRVYQHPTILTWTISLKTMKMIFLISYTQIAKNSLRQTMAKHSVT